MGRDFMQIKQELKKSKFFRQQVLYLLVLTFFILTCIILANRVFADNSSDMEKTEWKIHPTVGKFLYSEPPKHDQIFKVQYRVINGTVDSIKENQGAFGFKINATNNNGLFEIKIPLNFPHTNDLNETNGKNYAVLINDRYIDEYLNGPNIRDDCFFGFSIPFSKSVSIEVAPSTIPENFPYHGSQVPQHCIKETILSIPPLQQLKSGISANDIVCKEGFELIFKSKNDSPACVKAETKEKLIERGWAKPV